MVKNMLRFIIFLICLSCGPVDLITPRQSLNTNLRLDGYYVRKFTDPVSGVSRSNAKFLYKNGIALETFSQPTWSDSVVQAYLKEYYVNKENLDNNDAKYWGIVLVSGSTITIETRNPSLGSKAERTMLEKGTIQNSTSFEISGTYDRNGKKISSTTYLYEFKRFSPKPDSTNKYIK